MILPTHTIIFVFSEALSGYQKWAWRLLSGMHSDLSVIFDLCFDGVSQYQLL
jgi:hypothetical protein